MKKDEKDEKLAPDTQEEQQELDETTEETTEETETTSDLEEADLDWKAAAKKLKEAVLDESIEAYFKKAKVTAVRERYNGKERTQELFDLIMGL